MKISVLAAQYFYQHRRLLLPGIGTFTLDESVTIPDPDDKNFGDFLQHIQFKQSNIIKPDEDLISFIRTHTGKIKPLAESDLESYVADGKLLLNIGKPFHVEGIGTLMKNKEGQYSFTPGEPISERLESVQPVKDREKPEQKKSVFDEDYYPHEAKNPSRQLMILGGILLGVAVVIWGGYSLYNSNVETAAQVVTEPVTTGADTSAQLTTDSSAAPVAASTVTKPAYDGFKYIVETTARKTRALPRYKTVSEIDRRFGLEANEDSSQFKIYIILPTPPSDTNRVKDSLKNWYWGTRPNKVWIEQQ